MKLERLAQYKQFIIVGFGVEGKSSAKFLSAVFPHTDQEIIQTLESPLELKPNSAYIVSPGINRQKLLANIPTKHCTSNTEIFFENVAESDRKKIIGITGTKGKSTTTKFLYECLQTAHQQVAIGGNYGSPLLDHFKTIHQLDFLVAELSSYQLEFLKVSPFYSIFLNIFADHLDRHETLETYARIKQNIFNGTPPATHCLVPQSSRTQMIRQQLWINESTSQTIFTPSHPIDASIFPAESVFQAAHFRENFGCVQSLLKILVGAKTPEILKKTAQNFVGLPHRTEKFAEYHHVTFYDDSIASNPDTATAAIKVFGANLGAIILGGYSGGGTYEKTVQTLQKQAPKAFVWLPASNTRSEIIQTLKTHHFPASQIIQGNDFQTLMQQGFPLIPAGKSVILSPGAKSYDSFKNYQDRGKAWQESVHTYFA
ncbi:UDP-N-acetylmuramoyl-L-alanine--D-glutamate ligase [bacterium DOLZORAL124_38_8]|nr:MAG: UDP-N-acetylmuramoyl-L-alanine--D-glutamate ligase [bacterium DOLZORAL124_38_8]